MKSIFLLPATLFFFFFSFNLSAQDSDPTFQDFLSRFPKANLPYSFSADDLRAQMEKRATAPKAKRLAWEYYQFLPTLEESARFSRMPVHPEPVAAFETKENFAVLYNTGRGFTKNFKSYHIAVYDKQGNHLATHFVAGVNPATLTACTIEANLHAKVQAYQINWAKVYQEKGSEGNSIINLTPAGKQTIDLTTGGAVEQIVWVNTSARAQGVPEQKEKK